MKRVIVNECSGNGAVAASAHERYVMGSIACSVCGKWFKVRNSNNEIVVIPRHSTVIVKKQAGYVK